MDHDLEVLPKSEHMQKWCDLVCSAVSKRQVTDPLEKAFVEPPADYSGRVAVETLARRVAVGRQPRGKKIEALVPEDKQIVHMKIPAEILEKSWKRARTDSHMRTHEVDIPQGARRIEVSGEEGGPMLVKVGLPWTEGEFFEQAVKAGHPFDRPPVADEASISAIKFIAESGPTGFEEHLEQVINRIQARKATLQEEEAQLHATLHKDVESVIAGKQLLLLELLDEIRYVVPGS